jgi:hypothetical protein
MFFSKCRKTPYYREWTAVGCDFNKASSKVKGLSQQTEVAQGIPDRLRPRMFLTFGSKKVVGRQPYAPAAFTPGEIPGTHF